MGAKGGSGRPLKPKHLHLVDGTPGRGDVTGSRTPDGARGDVEAPGWLTPEALAIWNELAPEMIRLNLLTISDVPVFASLCVTYAEVQWATRTKRRWKKDATGAQVLHGVLKYRMQNMERLKMLAESFGMTPASRARVADVQTMVPADPADSPRKGGNGTTTRLGRPT